MFGSSGILESPSEEVSKKPYTSKERLQILSDKPGMCYVVIIVIRNVNEQVMTLTIIDMSLIL